MGVGDLLASVGVKNLPEVTGVGLGNFLQGFIFFIVLSCLVAGIVFYFANKRQYNKHIHLFEEINGQTTPVGMDKAKEIVLPNTSIRAIFLRKRRVYIPRPSIQTGKDHYWYYIRKDGEWNNVGLESLNKKLDELRIYADHTDMRMANASLKKLVDKNYKKLNWLKEYAPYIAMGMLIFILAISAVLVLNQANKTTAALGASAETNKEVAVALANIMTGLDNICSGSGIRSAISLPLITGVG